MWPDQVSNLGPLALESNMSPTEQCGPATVYMLVINDTLYICCC